MAEPVANITNEANILSVATDVPGQHLSGRQTAAILLMIFGEDEAADILSRLLPGEVQGLSLVGDEAEGGQAEPGQWFETHVRDPRAD